MKVDVPISFREASAKSKRLMEEDVNKTGKEKIPIEKVFPREEIKNIDGVKWLYKFIDANTMISEKLRNPRAKQPRNEPESDHSRSGDADV